MRLFSTDIDGTVYDGESSAEIFFTYWEALRLRPDPPLLVYNTGRVLNDARNLIASSPLPEPDYLICGVGTEIFDASTERSNDDWHRELDSDWSFETVFREVGERSPARPQPDECQNRFKCSWFWENAEPAQIDALVTVIEAQGIRLQAVYSSNRDLDFLPLQANKGKALTWLSDRLGVSHETVVVAGDSGNDASMFQVPGVRGIVVANAESALRNATENCFTHSASRSCAAGVIEGLDTLLNLAAHEKSESENGGKR